jgi:hypothetical protein
LNKEEAEVIAQQVTEPIARENMGLPPLQKKPE